MSTMNFQKFFHLSKRFFAGSSIASVCTFSAILLLSKSLSISSFGYFILIQAIVYFIEGISFSQSWQLVVKFGLNKKYNRLDVIKIAAITDLMNILLSAVVLLIVFFSFKDFLEGGKLLLVYAVILPFRMNGLWQGVARLTDKLYLINYQLIIAGIVKLIVSFLVFIRVIEQVEWVLVGFALADILGAIYLAKAGLPFVRKYCSFLSLFENLKVFKLNPDLTRFIVINHFNVTSVLSIRYLDEILIARLVSLESLAVYKLIKLISAFLSKVIEPMYIVIYPEIVKLLSEGDSSKLKELLIQITKFTSVIALLFFTFNALAGETVLNYFLTVRVYNDFIAMLIYVSGISINMMFFYAHPLAIAVGLESYVLKVNLTLGIIYLVLLVLLGNWLGLLGIALSSALYSIFSVLLRLDASNKKMVCYE
ncbi:hypothetical protein KO505_07165 [Psychrosphaera sp. F3M07]|uniref:hypothetical protein n=1 Tax=Psychrosphaera sp. F3M07 TaxID=2841560 RepID=UPI001C084359|nr:hypothetical protein [Psychrosphaera sp. F3M07]MBU2917741.1 hypothetical protein [Psychrosphaera sp. F3M07]